MTTYEIAPENTEEILRVSLDGIITINNKHLDDCAVEELCNAIKKLIRIVGRDVFKDVELK